MTEAQANLLEEAAIDAGIEVSKRDDYSGRGMYGSTCHAIVTDDPIKLLGALADGLLNNYIDPDDYPNIDSFEGLTTDSMGLGSVIY